MSLHVDLGEGLCAPNTSKMPAVREARSVHIFSRVGVERCEKRIV